MTVLITYEDVCNNLNIDLSERLGVKGQKNNTTVVNNWLEERHAEILDLIAEYAYGGKRKAEIIMSCPAYAKTLKKAVLYQCAYVAVNGSGMDTYGGIVMGVGSYTKIETEDRLENIIAPKALRILKISGLLCTRRC